MRGTTKSFLKWSFALDALGVASVEYALIAALLSIVVIGGYTLLSAQMFSVFRSIGETFYSVGN